MIDHKQTLEQLGVHGIKLPHKFYVKFKQPEIIDGRQMFGNDPLPADVYTATNNRVYVVWCNGRTTKCPLDELDLYFY